MSSALYFLEVIRGLFFDIVIGNPFLDVILSGRQAAKDLARVGQNAIDAAYGPSAPLATSSIS